MTGRLAQDMRWWKHDQHNWKPAWENEPETAHTNRRRTTMKTQDSFAATSCPNTLAGCLRTYCAARLLPLLLLLLLPAVVQAQDYTYTTNDDNTITIKG